MPEFQVAIPSPLRSYTEGAARVSVTVDAAAPRLTDVLAALDAAYPGIRFRMVDEQNRIRKHMKVFVNDEAVRDLDTVISVRDEITIMQALSGG